MIREFSWEFTPQFSEIITAIFVSFLSRVLKILQLWHNQLTR